MHCLTTLWKLIQHEYSYLLFPFYWQNGDLSSGAAALDLVSQGQRGDWDKAFILPVNQCGEKSLKKDESILHQVTS